MYLYFAWLEWLNEVTDIFQMRVRAGAGESSNDKILMLTETSESLVGSPAIFVRGGDSAQVIAHYRKIIAAKAAGPLDQRTKL